MINNKYRFMSKLSDSKYQSDDGYVMQREDGKTPNGNPMSGRWVLRNADGEMIDFNMYRYDLAEHNKLRLEMECERK